MQRWTAIRERYDPERGDEYVFCELDEDNDGDYVRFDDASAELARRARRIADLEAKLAAEKAAREEAEKLAVWAAKAGASAGWDYVDGCPVIWYATEHLTQTRDGTPVEAEEIASLLGELEIQLARQGQYAGAGVIASAAKRLRLDSERIARLEKALVWAMRNRVMLGFRAYADVRAIGWVDGVLNWDGTDESLIETLCWLAEGE